MEAVFNNDSSFFDITSDTQEGDKSVTKIINKDVISFNVIEELGKLTSGTLSMKDDDHIYSKWFRNGTLFNISWGYKNLGVNVAGVKLTAPVSGAERTGFKAIVQTPSGTGAENGAVVSNFTFYGLSFLNGRSYAVHENGSKADLISNVMDRMGIDDKIIDFEGQSDRLSSENSIRQRESHYNLLVKLANKWKSNLHIGFKPNGDQTGLFINPQKMGEQKVIDFIKKTTGTGISRKELFFNSGDESNVRSYNWKQHIGESGQGDGTRMTLINGKMVFTNIVVASQNVKVYKLNPEKIRKRFSKMDSAKEIITNTKNWLSSKKFEEVSWAFDEIEQSTAPQGMGYSVTCNMIGDPFLTIPLNIHFKEGFAAPLTQNQKAETGIQKVTVGDPKLTDFFIKKSTHNFSKSGYFTTLEIVDSYAVNGTAEAARTNIGAS